LILVYLIPIADGALSVRLIVWREYLIVLLGFAGSAPVAGADPVRQVLIAELTGSAGGTTIFRRVERVGNRLLSFFLFGTSAAGPALSWSAEFVLPVLGIRCCCSISAHSACGEARAADLWHACHIIGDVPVPPFGGSFDATSALGVPLAIFTAMLLQRIRKHNVIVASLLLALLVGYNVVGTLTAAARNPPGITTQFDPVTWIDHTRDRNIDFLLANGETRGYTSCGCRRRSRSCPAADH
jgi:hypothetical protein